MSQTNHNVVWLGITTNLKVTRNRRVFILDLLNVHEELMQIVSMVLDILDDRSLSIDLD